MERCKVVLISSRVDSEMRDRRNFHHLYEKTVGIVGLGSIGIWWRKSFAVLVRM